MTLTWPARRLIVGLAALAALFDLAVLLPGNPYYSSRDGFVAAVAIQALVLWGLWRGSVVAWVVALAFSVLTFLSLVLMQATLEAGVFLVLVVSVVQAAILCTREVRRYVDTGGRGVHTQRFPSGHRRRFL
jgi:bacteriorhodopsin